MKNQQQLKEILNDDVAKDQFSYQINPNRLVNHSTSEKAQEIKQEVQKKSDQEYQIIRSDILELMLQFFNISHPNLQKLQTSLIKMLRQQVPTQEINQALMDRDNLIDSQSYRLIASIMSTKTNQPVSENKEIFNEVGIKHFNLLVRKCKRTEQINIECSFYNKEDILRAIHHIKSNFITTMCNINKKSQKYMNSADQFKNQFLQYQDKLNNQFKIQDHITTTQEQVDKQFNQLFKNIVEQKEVQQQQNKSDLSLTVLQKKNLPSENQQLIHQKIEPIEKNEPLQKQKNEKKINENLFQIKEEQTNSRQDVLSDLQSLLKQAQHKVDQLKQQAIENGDEYVRKKLKIEKI